MPPTLPTTRIVHSALLVFRVTLPLSVTPASARIGPVQIVVPGGTVPGCAALACGTAPPRPSAVAATTAPVAAASRLFREVMTS